MDLRILLLDDELPSLRDPLQQALKPFLENVQVPALAGGSVSLDLTGLSDQPIHLTLTCNNSTTFRQVKTEIEGGTLNSEFDLVLLDDQWGGGEGEFAGQEVLLEPIFNKIHSQGGGSPLIALWTQEWEQETRTEKFAHLLTKSPFWGSNRVRGLSKTNTPGLRLLIQDVIASRQLKDENAALRKQGKLSAELAHSDLNLLNYTRHLVGIDDVILGVAGTLQPYFRWLKETNEQTSPAFAPERRRGQYVAGLLFEGEPASGKSALCKAIAEAFDCKTMPLDKSLGPGKHSKDWQKKLEEAIKPLYLKAVNDRTVIVVRADDLMWPALVGDDSAIAADWRAYMLVLRDFIRDATLINANKVPSNSGCLSKTKYTGKILWLFARNSTIDAGEMFAPLQTLIEPFDMKFPSNQEDRKQILKLHAERANYAFAAYALETATKGLIEYTARDLIGDEEAPRGFLVFATRKVYEREEERFSVHQDNAKADWTITEDIVNQWLESPQHLAIINRLRRRHAQLVDSRNVGISEPTNINNQQVRRPPGRVSKPEITIEGERKLLIEINKAISEGKSKNQIGKEYLNAKGDGRQAFVNHFRTRPPAQVFQSISEEEARETFSHVLAFLARNKAIHRDLPDLYPIYVKNYAQ